MFTRRLLVPLAVVPFVVGTALTGTASAATSAPAVDGLSYSVEAGTATADLQADAVAARPTVRLAKSGGKLQFSRDSVRVPRSGTASAPCTSGNAGFVITNTTAQRQPLRANGKAFGAIPAKGRVFICGFSTRSFSATFVTVNNTNNKLVARFS